MGKIANALERSQSELYATAAAEPLLPQDLDALLSYNRHTGKMNIVSRSVVQDPTSITRLIAHGMILPSGKVTKQGIRKCEEVMNDLRLAMAGHETRPPAAEGEGAAAEPIEAQDQSSDLEALQVSDAETGRLLKNDPETDAVDESAPGTAHKKGLVQSLVARGLIHPSGKPISKDLKEREAFDTAGNSGAQSSAQEESGEASAETAAGSVPLPAEVETDQREERRKAEVIIDERLRSAMPPLPPAARGKEEPEGTPVAQHAEASVRPVDETLVALLAQQSFEAEQFKILRTNLLYPVSGKPPRSILITSLDQGDGKSFVAANLAVSMALNLNRHVLVIDCDLRKPSMHTIFGFGDAPGLSEYISEGRALPSLLLRTKVERLSLLPAGTPPPNPSELLSSERMAALLQEVTRRYKDRLVLIDSPPPTLTAEPAVLARQVDGILLVAKYGRTRMPDLLKVAEKLGKEKILGSVINYFEHSVVDYYGYRKYGRYGRYQDGCKV